MRGVEAQTGGAVLLRNHTQKPHTSVEAAKSRIQLQWPIQQHTGKLRVSKCKETSIGKTGRTESAIGVVSKTLNLCSLQRLHQQPAIDIHWICTSAKFGSIKPCLGRFRSVIPIATPETTTNLPHENTEKSQDAHHQNVTLD